MIFGIITLQSSSLSNISKRWVIPSLFIYGKTREDRREVIMKNDYGQWVFVGCRDFKFYTQVKESLTLSGYLNYK